MADPDPLRERPVSYDRKVPVIFFVRPECVARAGGELLSPSFRPVERPPWERAIIIRAIIIMWRGIIYDNGPYRPGTIGSEKKNKNMHAAAM